MARLITTVAAFLAIVPAAPALAAEALDEIRIRLNAHPVVRAEFTQTRRIAALAKPLVTQGRLLVSRGEGVVWQIDQPYRSTYVLKQESMLEIAADGTRTVHSERDASAAARINQLVRALTAGDNVTLSNWFQTQTSLEGARWRIVLVPKQQQMAQYIKRVHLRGSEFVEEVEIESNNGDQTSLAFHKHRQGPLSADERRLFQMDR